MGMAVQAPRTRNHVIAGRLTPISSLTLMFKSYCLTLIFALAVCLTAKAQLSLPDSCHGSGPTVSLLTADPGPEIYQLEGHSGLRIRTDSLDIVANWGLFDFSSPNFVYRFVKGETDYCLGITDFNDFIYQYMVRGRRVTEQTLNLTRGQSLRLIELVLTAARPENRTYRYNYVLDNCATRPLRFIEMATGDSVRFDSKAQITEGTTTFRNVMRRFHANYPWYQFGIDLALGSGIDYPITAREAAFAPVVLEDLASSATIGDSIPLVTSTRILSPGPEDGPILPPTPWYLTPMAAMLLLLSLSIVYYVTAVSRHRLYRGWQALFFSVAGLAGCIVAFLVCISTHEATSPNWIILWLNPLCLLVPLLVFWRKALKAVRIYMIVNITMIILYGITCGFGTQSINLAFLPMALADIIMSITYLRLTRENTD